LFKLILNKLLLTIFTYLNVTLEIRNHFLLCQYLSAAPLIFQHHSKMKRLRQQLKVLNLKVQTQTMTYL